MKKFLSIIIVSSLLMVTCVWADNISNIEVTEGDVSIVVRYFDFQTSTTQNVSIWNPFMRLGINIPMSDISEYISIFTFNSAALNIEEGYFTIKPKQDLLNFEIGILRSPFGIWRNLNRNEVYYRPMIKSHGNAVVGIGSHFDKPDFALSHTGLGVNGKLRKFNYQFNISEPSLKIHADFTGRVGIKHEQEETIYNLGISYFLGSLGLEEEYTETFSYGTIISKRRIRYGLDLQYKYRNLLVFGEYIEGNDYITDPDPTPLDYLSGMTGYYIEVQLESIFQKCLDLRLQYDYWKTDVDIDGDSIGNERFQRYTIALINNFSDKLSGQIMCQWHYNTFTDSGILKDSPFDANIVYVILTGKIK